MNNSFLTTLTGFKGRLITLASGLLAAAIVRVLAKNGFEPDPETLNDITAASVLAATFCIDWLVIHLNAKGVKEIQKVLPAEVKVDGVAGEKTLAAVEKAVDNQRTTP